MRILCGQLATSKSSGAPGKGLQGLYRQLTALGKSCCNVWGAGAQTDENSCQGVAKKSSEKARPFLSFGPPYACFIKP
eukprot:917461-Pelagomonas_calceolata.AAC.9